MVYALGVDIGGTKIAAGLVDENGDTICRNELPSIPTDREEMFRQVVRCMEEVLSKSQLEPSNLAGIGLGIPGKVDCEKGIAKFQNNLPWDNFPLARRVKEHFPVEKVVADNDVFMAAYAEWIAHGKGRRETFVYLTISTGISCCTIHNGSFIRGTGFAGEVGFLPVQLNGSSNRYQGLEELASGPGIVRLAKEQASSGNYNGNENANILTSEKVITDFQNRQPYAVNTMNQVFDYISKGLYAISCMLDPDKFVLGGGVMNHNPSFIYDLRNSLQPYLHPTQTDILKRMYLSCFKGDSGLIGAGLRVHNLCEK